MQAAAKEADGVKAGVAAVATTRKSRQLEIFTGRSLVCVLEERGRLKCLMSEAWGV